MTLYRGSCHCGAVAFEASGDLGVVEVCNCSICAKTGYLHWYVEPKNFRLLTSEDAIADYQFGTHTAHNLFCRTCGISPFRRARSDPDKWNINVRCLEGVDIDSLEIEVFDGQNWERSYAERRPGPKD